MDKKTQGKTAKFAISMSATEFKELESLRQKTGESRSQFIRNSIRAWKAEYRRPLGVKEDLDEYKKEVPTDLVDLEERRRRAIAAAGQFRSGIPDLSSKHDEHLEKAYGTKPPSKDKNTTRQDQ
jgi:hypothetical protein